MEKKKKTDENYQRTKNQQIESFLLERYTFRFNTVKSKPEFMPIEKPTSFLPISKFDLNSFRRELNLLTGISSSADNLRGILESDFSPKGHPIREYLSLLPRINPKQGGQIELLTKTVTVRNPQKWKEYLTKWLIGVVANAMSPMGCQNHTCLVLTGEQGKFKTTWLDHLCPESLQNYLFTGKIDPQNKDVLTLIAEYLFINIDDQLKALNKRDENELKNLITTPAVKYRRPYDVYIEEYPHLASFMASVNGNDFLTDPTGSRRFLPFEVISIDIKLAKRINMDCVFSEILWLYDHKERYWFEDTEIEELHTLSRGFHVQSLEFEMLMQGFDKPPETEATKTIHFMTAAQILTYLSAWTSVKLSEKRLGEALRKAGFVRTQKRMNNIAYPVHGYLVKKIEPSPFVDRNLGSI